MKGPLNLSGALPVALGISLVVGIAIGAGAATLVKNGQIALIQLDHTRQAARHQAVQLERLKSAQSRGDALTNDLLAARAEADQLQDQLHAALSRVTTGRQCLGGGALRLLDRAASLRTDLPPAAGIADAADAGTAATDTQVAQWAGSAIHQYAECARRLDALIQFNEAPQ